MITLCALECPSRVTRKYFSEQINENKNSCSSDRFAAAADRFAGAACDGYGTFDCSNVCCCGV